MGKWPLMHYIVTFSIISRKLLSRTMRNTGLSVPPYTFAMIRCSQQLCSQVVSHWEKKVGGNRKELERLAE